VTDAETSGQPRHDTAARILDAALVGFAERGVEATSLDSLAVEIGVRKQTILYWFPSKDLLLAAVIDHAVAALGDEIGGAVREESGSVERRVAAAIDTIFRVGRTRPELLALLREVVRVGPHALDHLGAALAPLFDVAVSGVATRSGVDEERTRRALVEAGASVVGLATEAEVRNALGVPPDLAWLRRRRNALIAEVSTALA